MNSFPFYHTRNGLSIPFCKKISFLTQKIRFSTKFYREIHENFTEFSERKSVPRAFFEKRPVQAENREHDEERPEGALEHGAGQTGGEQGRKRGKDERREDERKQAFAAQKPASGVDGKGDRGHGQEGDEVDGLCRGLRHAEEGEERDEHRSAAHAHAAQNAACKPAREEH